MDRVWDLRDILPPKAPGATSSELTALGNLQFGWGVTKRTVERYLKELERKEFARTIEDPKKRKRANETQHWVAGSARNLRTPRIGLPVHIVLKVYF
jgi:hypothetical protein